MTRFYRDRGLLAAGAGHSCRSREPGARGFSAAAAACTIGPMPESECLQILLSHDRWATAQLLGACGGLTADKFHRRFDIGPGSLHDTLTHVIGVMRAMTETLSGEGRREPRPRLETDGQRRTPEQLRSLLEETWTEFSAQARRRPLDETVTRRTRDGKTLQMTRGAVLVHVATHGTHHRAQCLNMLRQLGVSALPPSSVAEWTWLGDTDA
jgi:uncharacterized damage-inducible protein DinB